MQGSHIYLKESPKISAPGTMPQAFKEENPAAPLKKPFFHLTRCAYFCSAFAGVRQ